MHLHSLHIYPVKSCRGINLTEVEVRPRGLKHDRRFVIARPDGMFITLRGHPKMAQIIPKLTGDSLSLEIDGTLYPVLLDNQRQDVTVWRDRISARKVTGEVNAALSDFLAEPLALYAMDDQSERSVNSDWAVGEVSFADGYPVLVTNTASLDALSKTAGETLSMARFRPNIVIETDTPWIEDGWRQLKIGEVELDLVKPCTRCVVTTLDPLTGDSLGDVAMRAMIKTRQSKDPRNKGVLFGVNAMVIQKGRVQLSAQIEMLV